MEPGGGWSDSSLTDVRPYTVTGGRTHAKHPLRLTSCLLTQAGPSGRVPANPESEALLLHCAGALRSVAELAGLLQQPVQVVKVLAGDLLDCQALVQVSSADVSADDYGSLLETVLHGLRNL
ncbi:DUF742 domain-containing protein [Streptomyces venezuelae]|uniref:DUF742 domain-containing protein n=1 Tax=Streptomyces venezuelae TaxID=54571 RepID=UPI003417D706